MKSVYILMSDGDGTMRSRDTPFGIAVSSKEEAERFVEEGGHGYTHSYEKIEIFDNKDDGIDHWKKLQNNIFNRDSFL